MQQTCSLRFSKLQGRPTIACVAMPPVHLRRSWEIQWKDGKRHSIPGSLIEDFEGRPFLRIRPTNYILIGLLSPGHTVKKASVASSNSLAKLISARNKAAIEMHTAKPVKEDGQPSLFENKANDEEEGSGSSGSEAVEPARKKCKRSAAVPPGDYTVQVPVGNAHIECLLRGKRPKSSDLMAAMSCEGLEALFLALAEDVEECLSADRRQYKKKAKK